MQILIIDNFRIIMDSLASALQGSDETFECFKTVNPESFLKENPNVTPEIILVSTAYQGMVDAHRKKGRNVVTIKQLFPGSKLIVFGDDPDQQISEYLGLGIDGYLSPEDSWMDLRRCIDLVLKGKKYVGLNLLTRMLNIAGSHPSKKSVLI